MDIDEKFLIPKAGLVCRDPLSKNILPEGGAIKPWTGPAGRYWRRRVLDGSCTIGQPKEKSKTVEKSSVEYPTEKKESLEEIHEQKTFGSSISRTKKQDEKQEE